MKFRLRQGKSETKWAFSNEAKWGGLSWATASEITDADKRRFKEVVEQGGVQPVARGGSKPRANSPLLPAVRGSQRLEALETARLAAAAMALPVATEPGALGAPLGDDLALLAASGAVAEQAGVRDEVVHCVQRLKDEVVRRTRVEKERAQERARRLQSYARAAADALLARANQRLRGALGKKRRSSWGRYNRDHARRGAEGAPSRREGAARRGVARAAGGAADDAARHARGGPAAARRRLLREAARPRDAAGVHPFRVSLRARRARTGALTARARTMSTRPSRRWSRNSRCTAMHWMLQRSSFVTPEWGVSGREVLMCTSYPTPLPTLTTHNTL